MPKPQIIVRKKDVEKYIPLRPSQLNEVIKRLLKVVPLSPGGRAVGVTLESIVEYQRDVMGLLPLPDDEADRRAEAAEQTQRSTRHD